MSEDHIKTVVIDLPVDKRADDVVPDQPRPEITDTTQQQEYAPGPPPPPSWLS